MWLHTPTRHFKWCFLERRLLLPCSTTVTQKWIGPQSTPCLFSPSSRFLFIYPLVFNGFCIKLSRVRQCLRLWMETERNGDCVMLREEEDEYLVLDAESVLLCFTLVCVLIIVSLLYLIKVVLFFYFPRCICSLPGNEWATGNLLEARI